MIEPSKTHHSDQTKSISIGRAILYVPSVMALAGPWLADMNRTHMFNPNWPPHSKFHDAITITYGTLAGAAGLYFLRRQPFSREGNLALAAALPGSFFLSQLSAFAFPNSAGLNAEFPEQVPKMKGHYMNEMPLALTMLAMGAAGYLLASRGATDTEQGTGAGNCCQ